MSAKLYVLKLQDGCFYVGKTDDLEHRLSKHFKGQGTAWTKKHRPVEVVCVCDEGETTERSLTIEMMKQHGIQNVRGAAWSQSNDFSEDRIRQLEEAWF